MSEITAQSNPFNKTEHYKLELMAGLVDRTTWWKDENTREPANVWWLTGGGENRLATVVEIDLWKQLLAAQAFQVKGKPRK